MFFLKIPRKFCKSYLFVLCLLIILILYNIFSVNIDWQYDAKFDYECNENGSEPYPLVLHYCIQGPKIFFTETSESRILNARQACAVESTARHNPSMSIAVLMTSPTGVDFSNELMQGLQKIQNVAIQTIDVDVFLHGTPLWEWYRNGKWKKSRWKVSHLSDALRFLVVWRYGGVYLDLDIVMLRSIEHLRNSAVTESWIGVASGILIFDKDHEILKRVIEDFCLNYDKNNFVSNGPGVISRNIKKYCDVNDFGKTSGATCGLTILPPEAAFPVAWDEWEKYFTPSNVTNVTSYFNSSYMIHVWNKYSKEGKIIIGERSLYEIAIQENCPITYKYAQKFKYV